MAEESVSTVVDGLDLRKVPKRGRSPKYPWEVWFDGRTHRLKQGEHYEAEGPRSFRSTVYSAADSRGVTVTTRIIDGDLYVQALLEDDESETLENGRRNPRGEEDEGRTS